jgi:hypothetical protein
MTSFDDFPITMCSIPFEIHPMLNWSISTPGRLLSLRKPPVTKRHAKADVVHITGGLNETWIRPDDESDGTVLRVFLRFMVSFMFTERLDVESVKAHFEGKMEVDFVGPERITVSILKLDWTLWDKGRLEPRRKYEFKVLAELPATAPCSLATSRGSIEYTFHLRFNGTEKFGHSLEFKRPLKVENPFLVFDVPRDGLTCGNDLESEMVGTMIQLNKDFSAFLRYPDQWSRGTHLSKIN